MTLELIPGPYPPLHPFRIPAVRKLRKEESGKKRRKKRFGSESWLGSPLCKTCGLRGGGGRTNRSKKKCIPKRFPLNLAERDGLLMSFVQSNRKRKRGERKRLSLPRRAEKAFSLQDETPGGTLWLLHTLLPFFLGTKTTQPHIFHPTRYTWME